MNKAELITSVAEKTGFTKKDAEKALNGYYLLCGCSSMVEF